MKLTLRMTMLFLAAFLTLGSASVYAEASNGSAPATGHSIVDRVASAIEHGVNAAARGVNRGVQAAAHGIEHGAKAAAHGVERAANATGNAARTVANKIDS